MKFAQQKLYEFKFVEDDAEGKREVVNYFIFIVLASVDLLDIGEVEFGVVVDILHQNFLEGVGVDELDQTAIPLKI